MNPDASHAEEGMELAPSVWRSLCRCLNARTGPAHAPALIDVRARAAFASIASQCCRRLAAECSKSPRDACVALSQLLAYVVEALWPGPYIRGEARQRNGEVLLFTDGIVEPVKIDQDARDAANDQARSIEDADGRPPARCCCC